MLLNSLVFHTFEGISSSPAAFLFLIFLSTESSSSCVNCFSLMSDCLLIIIVIGSCGTFGGFPSKFSKFCFHSCIRSSGSFQFSFRSALPFVHFVCHAILDCLSSTESLILSIWFCMYSVCSFRYVSKFVLCLFKFQGIDISWVPPIAFESSFHVCTLSF